MFEHRIKIERTRNSVRQNHLLRTPCWQYQRTIYQRAEEWSPNRTEKRRNPLVYSQPCSGKWINHETTQPWKEPHNLAQFQFGALKFNNWIALEMIPSCISCRSAGANSSEAALCIELCSKVTNVHRHKFNHEELYSEEKDRLCTRFSL